MAITLVQTAAGNSATFGTSVATPWGANTTTGNTIIVVVVSYSAGVALSVTDSQSNTYTSAALNSGNYPIGIFYAMNITGGAGSVTAHFSPSSTNPIVVLAREYSGLSTTAPFDVGVGASGTGTALSSGATAATANSVELVVGGGATDQNGTMTVGTGYGNGKIFLAGAKNIGMEDLQTTSAGAQTATFTNSFSGNWEAVVAAFKQSGGGGGAVSHNLTMLGIGQ